MTLKDAYLLRQLISRLGPERAGNVSAGFVPIRKGSALNELTLNAVANVDEALLDSVKTLIKKKTSDAEARAHFNLLLEGVKELSQKGMTDDAEHVLMFLDNWQKKLSN